MTTENLVATDAWEKGISTLAGELDPQIFSAYIKPLRLSGLDHKSSSVEVVAPSNFIRNQVDRNYSARLRKALSRELGLNDVALKLSVDPGTEGVLPVASPHVVVKKLKLPQTDADEQAAPVPSGLNSKYTFSSFVVGNSNQFCHAAAMRVAEEPGRSYNPLFIYGGVGLGKTHLLHAIGNAVLLKNPRARVVYMSSETFTNELIQALRLAKMDEFKAKMRSLDVLLIDDIQFMCGKERTQEEFFHTFNTLYNGKHQIVITSDKLPQDIPGLEERLQTRFSWGLAADLQAPDFETRVAIIKRKATVDSFVVPQDVASLIAEKFSSNVRELEGALTRLHAVSSLQGIPVTLDLAVSALRPLFQPKSISISIGDIKKAVAEQFGLKVSDLVSKRRTKHISFPRHIAMHLCRKHTTASYPEIGAHFGGRDHSSVIHAANVVSAKLKANTSVREIVLQVEKRLMSGN